MSADTGNCWSCRRKAALSLSSMVLLYRWFANGFTRRCCRRFALVVFLVSSVVGANRTRRSGVLLLLKGALAVRRGASRFRMGLITGSSTMLVLFTCLEGGDRCRRSGIVPLLLLLWEEAAVFKLLLVAIIMLLVCCWRCVNFSQLLAGKCNGTLTCLWDAYEKRKATVVYVGRLCVFRSPALKKAFYLVGFH